MPSPPRRTWRGNSLNHGWMNCAGPRMENRSPARMAELKSGTRWVRHRSALCPRDAPDEALHDLAWSPDGKQIAAHLNGGFVVFDLASTGRTVIPEQAPNDGIPEIGGFAW